MAANDILVIRIVFGIMLGVFSIVLFLLAAKFHKYTILHKCNSRTTGIVKRYTSITVGGDAYLPLVRYSVNGREYKIVGPMYKGAKVTSVTSPTTQNDLEFEVDEKGILLIKRHLNSFVKISYNPLTVLHPIGSEIDVYYYDQNPKVAYV